jgi:hypothetical protein
MSWLLSFHAFLLVNLLLLPSCLLTEAVEGDDSSIDAFEYSNWTVPPGLTLVDLENFESIIQSHELSIMLFYTKFSPYHRYAQRVLSNVSQDFDSNFSTKNIAFCAVDLDETPELSTYTHYNSIDIMAFYPHLMINGIRFDGNLTAENVKTHAHLLYQHSASQLRNLNKPFTSSKMETLVQHHMDANSENGFLANEFEMHLKQQRDILNVLIEISNNTGALAKQSNIHNQKLLRFNGREGSSQEFLNSRRLHAVYTIYLEHLYKPNQLPRTSQPIMAMHSSDAGRKKRLEREAAEAPVEEELF